MLMKQAKYAHTPWYLGMACTVNDLK